MIGSNTLVVKENNSFSVHVFGGWPGDFTFEELVKFHNKHKKKMAAKGLTDVDCYKILSSHQCNSDVEPDYSEFAGDALYLLDLDDRKVVSRTAFVDKWKNENKKKVAEIARDLERRRQAKIKEIEHAYEELEQEVLRVMETRNPLPIPANYSYDNPRVEYKPDEREVSFFIGHKYTNKVRGMKAFNYWFLARRKNLKILIQHRKKRYSPTDSEFIVDAYTFTHKKVKWLWHRAWGNDNEISEYVKA